MSRSTSAVVVARSCNARLPSLTSRHLRKDSNVFGPAVLKIIRRAWLRSVVYGAGPPATSFSLASSPRTSCGDELSCVGCAQVPSTLLCSATVAATLCANPDPSPCSVLVARVRSRGCLVAEVEMFTFLSAHPCRLSLLGALAHAARLPCHSCHCAVRLAPATSGVCVCVRVYISSDQT